MSILFSYLGAIFYFHSNLNTEIRTRRHPKHNAVPSYDCEKRVVSLAGQGDYIRLLQIRHRWMNFLLPLYASQLTFSLPLFPFLRVSLLHSSPPFFLLLFHMHKGNSFLPLLCCLWNSRLQCEGRTSLSEHLRSPIHRVETPHRRNISVEKLKLLSPAASGC